MSRVFYFTFFPIYFMFAYKFMPVLFKVICQSQRIWKKSFLEMIFVYNTDAYCKMYMDCMLAKELGT